MLPTVIVLYGLSALLPLWAVIRLVRRACVMRIESLNDAEQRGHPNFTWGDVEEEYDNRPDQARRVLRDALIDLALVGGGVVFGAMASIGSLFLP